MNIQTLTNNRGQVTIQLDRTRTIIFNFLAFSKFHELTGVSIDYIFHKLAKIGLMSKRADNAIKAGRDIMELEEKTLSDIMNAVGVDKIGIMLWATLITEDPSLTTSDVISLMNQAPGQTIPDQLEYIITKIFRAYMFKTKGIDIEDPEVKKKIESISQEIFSQNGNSAPMTPDIGNGIGIKS